MGMTVVDTPEQAPPDAEVTRTRWSRPVRVAEAPAVTCDVSHWHWTGRDPIPPTQFPVVDHGRVNVFPVP